MLNESQQKPKPRRQHSTHKKKTGWNKRCPNRNRKREGCGLVNSIIGNRVVEEGEDHSYRLELVPGMNYLIVLFLGDDSQQQRCSIFLQGWVHTLDSVRALLSVENHTRLILYLVLRHCFLFIRQLWSGRYSLPGILYHTGISFMKLQCDLYWLEHNSLADGVVDAQLDKLHDDFSVIYAYNYTTYSVYRYDICIE